FERLILYLNPTLVLLLGWVLYKRKISYRQGVAMAVSYSGVLLVFGHEVSLVGDNVALGAALVFASAITYAIYLSYSGQLVQRLGSLRLAGLATTVACVLCILQFALLKPASALEVAVLMVMMAIERIGPGLTSQIGMIGPMSTLTMGALLLNEPFNAWTLFNVWTLMGTALVLGGVFWVTQSPKVVE
ncbi:MAG: hypothetical protein RIS02_971, partial [Pseudomonadota bacterium]